MSTDRKRKAEGTIPTPEGAGRLATGARPCLVHLPCGGWRSRTPGREATPVFETGCRPSRGTLHARARALSVGADSQTMSAGGAPHQRSNVDRCTASTCDNAPQGRVIRRLPRSGSNPPGNPSPVDRPQRPASQHPPCWSSSGAHGVLPLGSVDQAPHPGWWKATDGKWYPPLPPSNGHAVASTLIGAAALALSILPPLWETALTAGIVATIIGFYAKISPVQRPLSITGITLGILASLLAIT